MRKGFFFLLLFAAVVASAQKKHPARSAYAFLQSIGVNSAIYRRGENLQHTIACVNYIGARWIRTDESMNTENKVEIIRKLNDVTGVKISTSLGSGGCNIPDLIEGSRRMAKMGVLLAVEGNNEPNNWGIRYLNEEGGRNDSWIPVARLHRDLYYAVKTDDVLKGFPVWATTETGAMVDNVGLQYIRVPENEMKVPEEFRGVTYADVANCHNYFSHPSWPAPQNNQTWFSSLPTSRAKGDHLFGNYGKTWLKGYEGYSETELKTLPRVTTETGITLSENVNEDMQGRMYMSCYLSQFAQGWTHTAIYILRDRSDEAGNQTFGFYDKEYRPRKAAHYLHNLTAILHDNAPAGRLRKLSYHIDNRSDEVHDLLLQKSNGTFFLVVWGEYYAGGERQVQIRLKRNHLVRVYNPISGSASIFEDSVSEIPLRMTTHPYVIEIIPK